MKIPLNHPFFRYSLLTLAGIGLIFAIFPGLRHNVFSAEGFMPHAHCYLLNPWMIWLHVTSDTLIGLAYVSISSTLAYLIYRARRDMPFHWMFLAFGLFIVSCGFTHFMEVWTVWTPVYWLAGAIKVITALASVTTAVALFPLVPKIFALINSMKVSEDRRLKLIAANQELEAFASSISHDLRAPLRTMQGMAHALKEDYGNSLVPDAHDYADRIIGASRRMDELIQSLLDYSRINLAAFELAPVDLKSLLTEASGMLAVGLQEQQAQLTVTGTFPSVVANRNLLLQVVINLITNAMKFVAPGVRPQITVRGEERDWKVRITVEDNGIGIAPDHQSRIFKMFERLHTAAEYPGTGVGLPIVQRAILRMGGTLGLESQLGKGSRFWFELPKA